MLELMCPEIDFWFKKLIFNKLSLWRLLSWLHCEITFHLFSCHFNPKWLAISAFSHVDTTQKWRESRKCISKFAELFQVLQIRKNGEGGFLFCFCVFWARAIPKYPQKETCSLFKVFCVFDDDELSHSLRCWRWSLVVVLQLRLTCCSDGRPCSRPLGLPVGSPLLQSPAQTQSPSSSSSSSAPLVWYSERGVCSLAISLLFIMAQTYEERWIPYPARVSACLRVCVDVCALVWGRSTCSVVSTAERGELATLYVQAEVTAQAQWIPLRERMRGSPFWAPRNRWERGVNSNEHLYTQCHYPTVGLDVRNGRFVQSPQVGLRSYSRAFSCRSHLLRECRLVFIRLDWKVWCLQAVRIAVIMFSGCCLCLGARKRACTLCQQQEDWSLSLQITYRYALLCRRNGSTVVSRLYLNVSR